MKKQKKLPRTTRTRSLALVSILSFTVVGGALIAFSSAATLDNPIGKADYCRLEAGKTIIYGWAHDNQAHTGVYPAVKVTVGPKTVQVNTDVVGYRDQPINDHLRSKGYYLAAQYGFKATFTGIYKGSNPTISGTILNFGSLGINQPLAINTGVSIPEASGGGAYFANNKVPDSCLPSAPVVTPPPAPTPTPTPTPTPAPTPTTTTKPSTNKPSTTNPGTTTQNTTPEPTPEPAVTISTFNLAVTITNDEAPVGDLNVKIVDTDKQSTTNSEGVVTFQGLDQSAYTLQFDYENESYEHRVEITEDQAGQASVLAAIDITDLTPIIDDEESTSEDSQVAQKSGGAGKIIGIIFLLIAAVIGVVLFIRKRRSANANDGSYPVEYSLPVPPVHHTPSTHQNTTPGPIADDAGVSLKDMVIQGMRDEAARRHDKDQS